MYCSGAIKISVFCEWGGVIMVITWFTWPVDDVTVNKVESTVDRFAGDGEAAGKCLTVCEYIPDPDGYFKRICNFWIPSWQGGIILGLQSKFDRPIMINNPTPCAKLCELVGIWPAAIFDRAVNSPHWSQFHDAGVIACTSLLISLSGKLHWSIFSDCPVF